jgi:hypothetical protein
MADGASRLERLESSSAGTLSLLLNSPSYIAFCAFAAIAARSDLAEAMAGPAAWGLVLAPFLTGGAVAHGVWARRTGRVGRRSMRVIWISTTLGAIAACGASGLALWLFSSLT